MTTDPHEAALRATQERLDVAMKEAEEAIEARRAAAIQARADGKSMYWIAQVLGVHQNSVRQILGLTRH